MLQPMETRLGELRWTIKKPKKRRVPLADSSSSLLTPVPVDSASPRIRLLDTRSLKSISCELRRAPTYIAIPHVWADELFPVAQKNDVGNAIGYQLAIAALRETVPRIHHIWVDTWCIDQDDDIDKHRQIRSMGQIYSTADFVLVTLHLNMNQTQAELDDIMSKLSKAARIMEDRKRWRSESVEYFESAEVMEPLFRGFAFLQSLIQSPWPTRLWCFQEAALARKLFWIGLDSVLLHIKDKTLAAVIFIPRMSKQLKLKFGPSSILIQKLMLPLIDHRLGWLDPTCVMEAANGRNSTFPEDEIYGLMGASGVTIESDSTKSLEMLWRQWWKEAIRLGHIRWLMLSWDSDYPNLVRDAKNASSGCIVPPLLKRARASRYSALCNCRPYGAVSVGEDCIRIPGYCVGTCSSFVHLGLVPYISDLQTIFTTVACMGRGDLELTMRIVAAMWYNNVSQSQIRSISKILCSEYRLHFANIKDNLGMRYLDQGRGNEERDLIHDFIQDTHRHFREAYDMELYLTIVENGMKKTEVIMKASEPIAPGNYLALDFNATRRGHSSNRSLMIAQAVPEATPDRQAASSELLPYLHKVGITSPVRFAKTVERVTAVPAHRLDDSPLEGFIFPLSTSSCSVCQKQESTAAEIRRWLGDLHEQGVEKIYRKDIHIEYQRRFGRGQVEFLPDVKDRTMIDKVLYRDTDGEYRKRKAKNRKTKPDLAQSVSQ